MKEEDQKIKLGQVYEVPSYYFKKVRIEEVLKDSDVVIVRFLDSGHKYGMSKGKLGDEVEE